MSVVVGSLRAVYSPVFFTPGQTYYTKLLVCPIHSTLPVVAVVFGAAVYLSELSDAPVNKWVMLPPLNTEIKRRPVTQVPLISNNFHEIQLLSITSRAKAI